MARGLGGSMVALVTPMTAAGEVDREALAGLIDWHVESGTDALVPTGTTGESATLTREEHLQVIAETVRYTRGRLPVIAGSGSNATAEAIDYSMAAEQAGADACLLVTPYYNRPTQEGLYRHFCAVADRTSLPLVLYNVPARTASDLLPETVARLAELDGIVAIKEATGKVARARQILELCGDALQVYSGDDATALDLLLAGAVGVISVTANLVPAAMHELVSLALAGETQAAARLNEQLMPLHAGLFLEANPIPVKWALHRMGRIAPGIRLPLTQLGDDCRAPLLAALELAGVALPEERTRP